MAKNVLDRTSKLSFETRDVAQWYLLNISRPQNLKNKQKNPKKQVSRNYLARN